MTSRKKPGVAFWAAVAISLPVLYVLSAGPANWLWHRGFLTGWPSSIYSFLYWPIRWLLRNGPDPVSQAILWYVRLWEP